MAVLTTPADLRAWQRRCGLRTDVQAAAVQKISVSSYRRKLKGRAPITERDELIAFLWELHAANWLAIATAARNIGALVPVIPIPPVAAEILAETLTKAGVAPGNGHK